MATNAVEKAYETICIAQLQGINLHTGNIEVELGVPSHRCRSVRGKSGSTSKSAVSCRSARSAKSAITSLLNVVEHTYLIDQLRRVIGEAAPDCVSNHEDGRSAGDWEMEPMIVPAIFTRYERYMDSLTAFKAIALSSPGHQPLDSNAAWTLMRDYLCGGVTVEVQCSAPECGLSYMQHKHQKAGNRCPFCYFRSRKAFLS